MKIRQGFVSNSSSSSFVIPLKEEPKDVNHLHMLLHNTNEEFMYDCIEYDENYVPQKKQVSSKYLTEWIFNKFQLPKEEYFEKVKEDIKHALHDASYNYEKSIENKCIEMSVVQYEIREYLNNPLIANLYFHNEWKYRRILAKLVVLETDAEKITYKLLRKLEHRYKVSYYGDKRKWANKKKVKKLFDLWFKKCLQIHLIRQRHFYKFIDMFTEAYFKEFCRMWKNYHVYDIEVADETHIGSLIEHGEFFATSALAKISHH